MGAQVPRGRAGCAGGEAARAAPTDGRAGDEAAGRDVTATRASGVGDASDPGSPGAIQCAGSVRDSGAGDSPRGGASGGGAPAEYRARARTPSLRAGSAQSAVAVGHLHVSAAAARAALPVLLHGRPLAIHRGVGGGASPAVGACDGSIGAWRGRFRKSARGADRPGAAVHGVARHHNVRGDAAEARYCAREESPAAPADAGQGGALLEDALG